ncbi:MAG: DUF262 domain-containing protein [Bacteroidales bacterium]|jgi:hypothetical protein|nr:DUF262 domain-containing protein [Bacteroidales bacterium]
MEFNLKNEQVVFLNLLKKETRGARTFFDLIDATHNVWIELELYNNQLSILGISDEITDSQDVIDTKLDALLSSIIETESSGTDSYNEGDAFDMAPYDPDKIRVRTDKIPITLIAQMIDNNEIDLNPDFQRLMVWDQTQKSRLIESILLRIPLPMFYFAEDREGKLSVVDGLQRIRAIKDFMDNKFALKNLQYLQDSCGGRVYQTHGSKTGIDSKFYRWFNLTTLSANIIDPTSPYKIKYDIFRRINTGGRPLNNQEIRNCLTGRGMREAITTMTRMPEFRAATDNGIKAKRMEDREVCMRFMLFSSLMEKGELDRYNGYMETWLDEFTEAHVKTVTDDFAPYIRKFSNAMRNAEYLLGRQYAFRKITPKDLLPGAGKQLINKALFVCISTLLSCCEPQLIREKNKPLALLKPLAGKIASDRQLYNYLSYGTNGKANIQYTLRELKLLIENTVNC